MLVFSAVVHIITSLVASDGKDTSIVKLQAVMASVVMNLLVLMQIILCCSMLSAVFGQFLSAYNYVELKEHCDLLLLLSSITLILFVRTSCYCLCSSIALVLLVRTSCYCLAVLLLFFS